MISRFLARAQSLWRGIRRGSALRHDMHAEFQHHIELRADDLVRDGLSREEATRRARLEFGSPIFLESSDGGLANWIDHVPYRRRAL